MMTEPRKIIVDINPTMTRCSAARDADTGEVLYGELDIEATVTGPSARFIHPNGVVEDVLVTFNLVPYTPGDEHALAALRRSIEQYEASTSTTDNGDGTYTHEFQFD